MALSPGAAGTGERTADIGDEDFMRTILNVSTVGPLLGLLGASILPPMSAPAFGQTLCGTRVIKAAGASALLEGGARSKARSAWMQRVSASKRLGPAYSTWLRAKQPHYECKHSGKAHVCVASAIPCKI